AAARRRLGEGGEVVEVVKVVKVVEVDCSRMLLHEEKWFEFPPRVVLDCRAWPRRMKSFTLGVNVTSSHSPCTGLPNTSRLKRSMVSPRRLVALRSPQRSTS